MKIQFLLLCALPLLASAAPHLSYPLHASCKIHWTFEMACSDVGSKMSEAIKSMGGTSGCDNGSEKCLYTLTKNFDERELKATHKTPEKHYTDDLDITFSESGNTCEVQGYSTSETWYAYLDSGTNYCNLHNIITAAGLDKVAGYSESTSTSQCTQYDKRNCDKY